MTTHNCYVGIVTRKPSFGPTGMSNKKRIKETEQRFRKTTKNKCVSVMCSSHRNLKWNLIFYVLSGIVICGVDKEGCLYRISFYCILSLVQLFHPWNFIVREKMMPMTWRNEVTDGNNEGSLEHSRLDDFCWTNNRFKMWNYNLWNEIIFLFFKLCSSLCFLLFLPSNISLRTRKGCLLCWFISFNQTQWKIFCSVIQWSNLKIFCAARDSWFLIFIL